MILAQLMNQPGDAGLEAHGGSFMVRIRVSGTVHKGSGSYRCPAGDPGAAAEPVGRGGAGGACAADAAGVLAPRLHIAPSRHKGVCEFDAHYCMTMMQYMRQTQLVYWHQLAPCTAPPGTPHGAGLCCSFVGLLPWKTRGSCPVACRSWRCGGAAAAMAGMFLWNDQHAVSMTSLRQAGLFLLPPGAGGPGRLAAAAGGHVPVDQAAQAACGRGQTDRPAARTPCVRRAGCGTR